MTEKKKKKKKIDYEEIEKNSLQVFEKLEPEKRGKRAAAKLRANKKLEKEIKRVCTQFFKQDQNLRLKKTKTKDDSEESSPSDYYSFKALKKEEEEANQADSVAPDEDPTADEEYTKLVDRIYVLLKKRDPNFGTEKGRIKIKPPQIGREPRKTILMNFPEIAHSLKRQEDHLKSFILSELETQGNYDSLRRLVIRGIFYQKDLEVTLKKYIEKYLQCAVCKRFDTVLTRDSATRLYNLVCQKCGANRTVTSVAASRRRR